MAEFARLHAHRATAEEKAMLEEFLFGVDGRRRELRRGEAQRRRRRPDHRSGSPSRPGFSVPDGHLDHPGRGRRGRPGRAADAGEARARAGRAAGRAHRARHRTWPSRWWSSTGSATARAIHTEDDALAEEFGRRVKAVRIIANAPASLGGIGDIYNAFIPSLTLGCGSYGHNSVSDNVSAVNLLNIKRIGRRNNNLQWFKVPAKTYFEPNAIRYLARHARRATA